MYALKGVKNELHVLFQIKTGGKKQEQVPWSIIMTHSLQLAGPLALWSGNSAGPVRLHEWWEIG